MQSPARYEPLHGNPAKIPAKIFENPVFQRIERRPIDVAALGRDNLVGAIGLLQDARDAKPRARPNDGIDADARQITLRSAHVAIGRLIETRDGMPNRGEVVDDDELLDAQSLFHERGTNDPGIVRELQHVSADRSGKGDRQLRGKRLIDLTAELLPGMLEA